MPPFGRAPATPLARQSTGALSPLAAIPQRRPPVSFATTPQGQQEMTALKDRLHRDLEEQARADVMRHVIGNPAANPLGATNVAANPFERGMASVQGVPADRSLQALASAYNAAVAPRPMAQPPQPIIQNGQPAPGLQLSPRALGMIQQYNQINARPNALANAGAPMDPGLGPDSNNRPPGQPNVGPAPRINPNPPVLGTPSPGRAAEMIANRPQIPMDPAALQKLQAEAAGLMQQAKRQGPNGPQLSTPTNQPLSQQPFFKPLIAAERARDALPADQQSQIQLPTMRGNQNNGMSTADAIAKQQQDPRYIEMMARRSAQQAQSQRLRTGRAQEERQLMNGVDPSYIMAMNALGSGGGGGNPGMGMNPAQLNALMMMHPEAAGAIAQGAMQMPAQMAQANVAQGQLALQQKMMENQIAQQKQEGTANQIQGIAPGHERNVAMVRATPGGFKALTPSQQRGAVLDALHDHHNAFASANARAKLNELGIDPVDAYIALDGLLPESTIGRIGGLARRGAELIKGNGDPVKIEQQYRQQLAAEAGERGYKPRNR